MLDNQNTAGICLSAAVHLTVPSHLVLRKHMVVYGGMRGGQYRHRCVCMTTVCILPVGEESGTGGNPSRYPTAFLTWESEAVTGSTAEALSVCNLGILLFTIR